MTPHTRYKLIALYHSVSPGKLPWKDVLELIEYLGKVEPQRKQDELAFIVGSQREVFQKPHTHAELAVATAAHLRRFLKAAGHESPLPEAYGACRMIVTIGIDEILTGRIRMMRNRSNGGSDAYI